MTKETSSTRRRLLSQIDDGEPVGHEAGPYDVTRDILYLDIGTIRELMREDRRYDV